MKKSKNISLFRIACASAMGLYFKNNLLVVILLAYLLLINYKDLVLFLLLAILVIVIKPIDPLPYGYVENSYENYAIVNKIFYKTKVNVSDLSFGQIVKTTNNSYKYLDEKKQSQNIIFVNYDEPKIIFKISSLSLMKDYINTFEETNQSIYQRILYNEYSDTSSYVFYFGNGFCFYYFLKYLLKKKRPIALLTFIIYCLLFGFELKLLIFLIDFVLSFLNLDNLNKLAIKIMLIAILNPLLFNNYSFLVIIILNLLYIFDLDDKYHFAVVQSLLFGEINIFLSYGYQIYLKIRLLLLLMVLISLLLPNYQTLFVYIINIFSEVLKVFSYSIHGKIRIIFLILLSLIFKFCQLNKPLIKQLILYGFLLLNLNNPLKAVTFIDVGQGDAIVLQSAFNKESILIDTGSQYNYYKLKKQLYSLGIYKLDYLIITHDDSDHNGNLANLQKDFKVKQIVDTNIDVKTTTFNLENRFYGHFDNDNENSLIYYAKIDDYYFLFTGDITSNIEKLIINDNEVKQIDILKVSHHGSKTATSNLFIGNFKPKFAVISTNGQYGHPSEETINCLDSYYVDTFITKDEGSISFYFSNIVDFLETSKNHFVIISS